MILPPLAVGQRIDGFELEQHVHRGGMASLWRVSRPDLSFAAVMKVPSIQDDLGFSRGTGDWRSLVTAAATSAEAAERVPVIPAIAT